MTAAAKLTGVGPDRINDVIDSLTPAEVIDLFDRWICQITFFVMDEFAGPLGVPENVDSMAVVCRLYRRYMDIPGPVAS